jgi:hypothetical protein
MCTPIYKIVIKNTRVHCFSITYLWKTSKRAIFVTYAFMVIRVMSFRTNPLSSRLAQSIDKRLMRPTIKKWYCYPDCHGSNGSCAVAPEKSPFGPRGDARRGEADFYSFAAGWLGVEVPVRGYWFIPWATPSGCVVAGESPIAAVRECSPFLQELEIEIQVRNCTVSWRMVSI